MGRDGGEREEGRERWNPEVKERGRKGGRKNGGLVGVGEME